MARNERDRVRLILPRMQMNMMFVRLCYGREWNDALT